MLYTYLLLTVVFIKSNGLIPPQFIIRPFETDLQGIISSKAIVSSIVLNLKHEISNDKLIFQIANYHPMNLLYITIAISLIYNTLRTDETKYKKRVVKLYEIDEFVKTEGIWKNIMLVIIYL